MITKNYGFIVTVLYASIYALMILITSIVCAIKVRQIKRDKKSKNKSLPNDTIKDVETAQYETDEKTQCTKDETNARTDTTAVSAQQKKEKCYDPIKQWFSLVKEKRNVYLSLVPHIFDQATDYGVIFTYYSLWKDIEKSGDEEIGDANPKIFFYASIFIIILHRILSAIAIYKLTRNWKDVLMQCFDILIAKAIWVNYKLNKREPSNPQRYLQILEASFESAPQILISAGYILKSSTDEQAQTISPLIYISVVFSLWSLVSRVAADDKMIYGKKHSEWKELEFKYNKCPCVNWRYLLRVFGWRFLEITNRVFMCVLLWVNIGGLGLCVILGIEFLFCVVLCVIAKSIDPLASLMYVSFSAVTENNNEFVLGQNCHYFMHYRILSNVIYIILITIFAAVSFEETNVEEASTRHAITIENSLGLFMLIYTWVTCCIWPCTACCAMTDEDNYTVRDVKRLVKDYHYQEVFELLEFGGEIDADILNVLYKRFYRSGVYTASPNDRFNVLKILQKVVSIRPSLVSPDDEWFDLEESARKGGSVLHLLCYAFVRGKEVDRDLFKEYYNYKELLEICLRNDTDIDATDNDGDTALHVLARFKQEEVTKYQREYAQHLLLKGITVSIKNNEGKTAVDISNNDISQTCRQITTLYCDIDDF